MENGQNILDINNSNNENLKALNTQSKNSQEFTLGLSGAIKKLQSLREETIQKGKNDLFGTNEEKTESLIKELDEAIRILTEMKNSKEEIEQVTLPLVKEIELGKDYDGDGLINKDEIARGTNIMVNEKANEAKESKKNIPKETGQVVGEIIR